MEKEIKKINKISLANIIAIIYGVIGFFVASFSFVFSLSSAIVNGEDTGISFISFIVFNVSVSIILGLLISIITGAIGWVGGFFMGLFYNMTSSRFGGIKIELNED